MVLAVEGLPVADLVPGTQLEIGHEAVVEILAIGEAAGDAAGPRSSGGGLVEATGAAVPVPTRVIMPGPVRVGDAVVVSAVAVPLDDVLDLHPFRPDETAEVVREYVAQARAAGLREVRVVHGRGRGIQREIVRRLLPALPGVTGFGDAPPERGGWGATVVRLRSDPEATPR
jgi:hypothetical protein